MSSLVARLHDAAVTPEAWPDADAAVVAGAALIILNKSTGKVDEAHFCGLSARFKSDYVRHYAALDPYSPLLDGSWKKALRVSSGPAVTKQRMVQRFHIDVWRSRIRNKSGRSESNNRQARSTNPRPHGARSVPVARESTCRAAYNPAATSTMNSQLRVFMHQSSVVLGTHLSAITSAPTSTAPLDKSDGIRDKFDYV